MRCAGALGDLVNLLTYGKILLDSLGNGLLCPENSFCKERLYERVEDFQLLLRSQDHRLLRSPIIGADPFRPSLSHSVKLEDLLAKNLDS